MKDCDRCDKPTNITIMSMFNAQMICMDCKGAERKLPEYKAAESADIASIKQGDFNFEGIGLP